jgi:hypothetical protein
MIWIVFHIRRELRPHHCLKYLGIGTDQGELLVSQTLSRGN